MNLKKRLTLAFCTMAILHTGLAQDKPIYKFGKITAADFGLTADKFDSGYNALILSENGKVDFEGNNKGSFTMVFTHFIRVKIVNKNGFETGNREIHLYHGVEDREKLTSVKGSTFNLENGVITETKLDEKSIFEEKYNQSYYRKKFTMPALKEGSIFDLEYTVKSPFLMQLQPWAFQGEYPVLQSEFIITTPPPLFYVVNVAGDRHFEVDTTQEVYMKYTVTQSNGSQKDDYYNVSGNSIYKRWVKKNVVSLKEEPFITTLDNYYSKVTFQLKYIQWDKDSERHDQRSTWSALSKALLEDENFGQMLDRENGWMTDELTRILQGAKTDNERTFKIYCYVRDNFKAVSKDGYSKNSFWARHALKEVFKKGDGNVAEINLLLIAMLRKAGIKADPTLLSTRENGIANPSYPLLDEYNYVVCIVYSGEGVITLDASDPNNAYGHLPQDCYNGWAHVMNEAQPLPVPFFADSLHESSSTNVFIFNDEKGVCNGSFTEVMGNLGSNTIRSEISSSSLKDYEKKIQSANESVIALSDFGVDSLKKPEFPATLHFNFEMKNFSKADILYMNPMLEEGYKTNPFKSMTRHYPVEMPFRIDETYILSMDIPKGYQVDELPKSARVAYNENEGMFEYLIQKGESDIQMRVRLKLNKVFFPTDEYETLRDFFAYVVKKEGEQIVFKKIK